MIDNRRKGYALMFLFGMFLLGVLNLLAYSYIPFNGVLMTLFFLAISFTAAAVSYHDIDFSNFYWMLFSSFNFVVLLSRVFVNNSGIGTPKSTGSLGPLTIEQFWVGGIHLHHYWIGFLLIFVGFYMLRKQASEIKTAAVLGTGIGLVVDELGILLAGHTYHSWISYAALITVNVILFLSLFRFRLSKLKVGMLS